MLEPLAKNTEKPPIPPSSSPQPSGSGRSGWSAMFPNTLQQTAFVLFWGLTIAAMAACVLLTRGPQLIDIDQAEFRQTHFLVDINSATTAEFSCLPGIGKKKAESIVAFRDQHGPFQSVKSMVEVPGVSQRLLDSLQNFFHVPARQLADENCSAQ